MRVQGYGLSDVGSERTNNEDSLLIDNALSFFIVADGMGGHAAGEVASSNAVRAISRYLHERGLADLQEQGEDRLSVIVRIAEEAVLHACRTVWEMATSGQGYAGMGTTLTLLLVVGTKGIMMHVGDSRLYLTRAGRLHQISNDHTFTGELIRNGVFTPEQARHSPYAHVLTRALGKSETVQVDRLVFDILPGDTFLLCSDGLTGYVENDELVTYLDSADIRELPQRFIDLANMRGGQDNITAIVTRVAGEETMSQEMVQHSTRVQHQFETIQAVYLLKNVPLSGVVRFMDISKEVSFKVGDCPIEEGRAPTDLFILLDGELEVTRQGYQVAKLGPGAHAGDMSFLRQRPSTATLRVINAEARCLTVSYDDLQMLIREEPALGIQLLRNVGEALSDRLDETTQRLLAMSVGDQTLENVPAVIFVP